MIDFLPKPSELAALLALRQGGEIGDLVAESLLNPLGEFLARPAKRFRGSFVALGWKLAGGVPVDADLCAKASSLLEAIHAASLVVDDIEDESLMRRGRESLHLQHGVPRALNAGNWLYFWPFARVVEWGLPDQTELQLYRSIHAALLEAHVGQALDVGVPISSLPQARIPGVCLASLELKTGALLALALVLGAVLGGATEERRATLRDFGRRFGVALQMFDDLGNLRLQGSNADQKRYEDLKLDRPSWVWAAAAQGLGPAEFESFRQAVRALPDDTLLLKLVASNSFLQTGKAQAREQLWSSVNTLRADLPGEALAPVWNEIERLAKQLESAYD